MFPAQFCFSSETKCEFYGHLQKLIACPRKPKRMPVIIIASSQALLSIKDARLRISVASAQVIVGVLGTCISAEVDADGSLANFFLCLVLFLEIILWSSKTPVKVNLVFGNTR